jgi:hypothetical protein
MDGTEMNMKKQIWNELREAVTELLAREAHRMSVADCTLRPFTPLEWFLPAPAEGCSGLAG